MSPVRLGGLLLISGTLIFWLGALLPTWRVYVTRDPDVQVRLITELYRFWVLSHILFLAGAVVTTVGLGVFSTTVESADGRLLAIAGVVAIVLGTLALAYIVFAFRLSMPAAEWVRSADGTWAFPAYTVLTLAAFILFGIVLLPLGYPTWLGVASIGVSALLLIAFVVQRDSIPASLYVPSLIIGIVFLLDGS